MTKAKPHLLNMCDLPLQQSPFHLSHSISQISCSDATYYHSDSQFEFVDQICREEVALEVWNITEEVESLGPCPKSCNSYPYRLQLEQDVKRLQQKLEEEMELHVTLENAIKKNAVKLPSQSCLPHHAQELLSNIAVLETIVSDLEKEMISLHFQISQERNERRLAEYRLKQSSSLSLTSCSSDDMESPVSSSMRPLKHFKPEPSQSSEGGNSFQELGDQPTESTGESFFSESISENAEVLVVLSREKKPTTKPDSNSSQSVELRKKPTPTGMPHKGLWDHPNLLSEEMVRCMKNIFMSLADSAVPSKSSAMESHSSSLSPRGHLSSSSWWSSSERSMISSWVQSPQIDVRNNCGVLASDNVFDPYRVRGKLSWVDIGNYGLATEVSWMSVGKKQLEYASGALRRFRILVEQLAKVNPIHLSCNEKLAFWINLYNALIMHAYLAYGVPRSDLKLFSLMQKASYTVGGHSYSAAAIEYVILKMKPPMHRPQIALLLALHKLKVSEEQRRSAIDVYEPLLTFALSCGMYSSPAVRIYTGKNVKEELQEAQHDYIRASVGVSSKGKLLVPKMLHCFAKGLVDDTNLAVWISHYLPPAQAVFVEQCISQRRQSLLGSRNCGILPFDSRFRYLFVPDKILES